ncbi:MAG: addiction module protein [Chthoniobacterales bacterium]|nr:addiction module protein [Chthoniobacterales bacterium]
MSVTEVEKLALALSEQQRATLAASLLQSLPPVLADDEEGLTEALRRDAEMNADGSHAISLHELDETVRSRSA